MRMSPTDGSAQYDDLARAMNALDEAGIEFFGPSGSSKGDLFVIGDRILRLSEIFELSSKGQHPLSAAPDWQG